MVLERDNRSNLASPSTTPGRKSIHLIDTDGATDVSDVASLPAGALPGDITPVSKTLFIDLLDPDFGLAATIPEKIEGLTWGPDPPDGRHLLYVISDNDLSDTLATQLLAFAIEPSALPGYRKQRISDPLFPPGQVRRAID